MKQRKSEDQVESAWACEVGHAVTVDGNAGEVTWRRENHRGERDYLVKTQAGEAWVPEASIQVA